MQKAFLHRINGVIEHNQVLQEIYKHAKSNQRTVHSTFFDLEDAFGSVNHDLIIFSLERFHLPENFVKYVKNLYSSLNGSVTGPNWTSDTFKFRKGVFQGDPLSPIIFLCAFNPILEMLKLEQQRGYKLGKSSIISTPFADDFNLITTNKRTHQRLINDIEKWTVKMKLKLKPSKCRSLSLMAGTPSSVKFTLNQNEICTLVDDPHKFLGSQLTFSGKQSETLAHVQNHFSAKLENINSLLVRDEYKLQIFDRYMLPASRFILTVHELSLTNVRKLDSLCNSYLKKWSGLSRCATPGIIHSREFLDIKTIEQLYKECHVGAYISSRLKGDSKVQDALDSKLYRETEWSRKFSISKYSDGKFLEASAQINQGNAMAQPIDKQIQTIKKVANKSIFTEINDLWKNHVKSLTLQGNFYRLLELQLSDQNWNSIVYNLPRGVLKFVLNSILDTNPTNANLARWGKRINSRCALCGSYETLLHTLNACKKSLDQGKFTWRHDNILSFVYEHIVKNLTAPSQFSIIVDLPDIPKNNHTTVPVQCTVTNQRPDLVLFDNIQKHVTIVELTVPFDTNVSDAHQRKTDKYAALLHDIEASGYITNFFAIEIGARGFMPKQTQKDISKIFQTVHVQYNMKAIRDNLCKLAMVSSFVIFCARKETEWTKPPILKV